MSDCDHILGIGCDGAAEQWCVYGSSNNRDFDLENEDATKFSFCPLCGEQFSQFGEFPSEQTPEEPKPELNGRKMFWPEEMSESSLASQQSLITSVEEAFFKGEGVPSNWEIYGKKATNDKLQPNQSAYEIPAGRVIITHHPLYQP